MNRVVCVFAGLAMIAAVSPGAPLFVLVLAAACVVTAVLAPIASLAAVGVSIAALALGGAEPILALAAGLAAAAHLIGSFGTTVAPRTALSAIGFGAVAVTAAEIPGGVTWLPVVAPIAALLLFALVLWPFDELDQRQDDIRERGRIAFDDARADQ